MTSPCRVGLLVLALCVGVASHAHAHASAPSPRPSYDPLLWCGLGLALLAFALGERALRRRGAAAGPRRRQRVCFALALATLVGALASPLDAASDRLFSAHMVQHELLMLIAAPLLALARPLSVYVWALPASTRLALVEWLRRPRCARVLHVLGAPLLAVLVHGGVRWLWHIPALFEACLHDEALHGVQHATFFLSALWFWWSLLQGGYGKLGYGASVLFVFVTALHGGALGVLISLARQPLYPSHAARTAAAGGDALLDQQLAGLVMWVIAGTLLTAVGLALFLAWLGHASRRQQQGTLAQLMASDAQLRAGVPQVPP